MDNSATKERVRAWLAQRHLQRSPLPAIEQIQRQVGWCVTDGAALAEPAQAQPALHDFEFIHHSGKLS